MAYSRKDVEKTKMNAKKFSATKKVPKSTAWV